jgi:hypothetical protein
MDSSVAQLEHTFEIAPRRTLFSQSIFLCLLSYVKLIQIHSNKPECGHGNCGYAYLKYYFSPRQNKSKRCLHTAEVGSSNLPSPTLLKLRFTTGFWF